MEKIVSQLMLLKSHPNTPQFVDFQVLACRNRDAEGNKYHLVLSLLEPETKNHICSGLIYPGEWFPGRQDEPSFSHYHNVLRFCFAGFASEKLPAEILLQVLKAVWIPGQSLDSEGWAFLLYS